MPPKEIPSKKPSRHDVRVGRVTKVANAIPAKLRKPGVRQETEHVLQHHVNKRNLANNPLRLSPITVSDEKYFNQAKMEKLQLRMARHPYIPAN